MPEKDVISNLWIKPTEANKVTEDTKPQEVTNFEVVKPPKKETTSKITTVPTTHRIETTPKRDIVIKVEEPYKQENILVVEAQTVEPLPPRKNEPITQKVATKTRGSTKYSSSF